ncbi:MAG TPA: M56 family metallopeptidase [Gemmatimonadales bacterium]|nr:M56 family metallopeptidase [Gemmatimonadales bacterium]
MTAFFLNHLWQSTLFAAAIALLTLALRDNRARLRYGLWLAASVKFLVPFSALAAVGSLVQWEQAPAPIRSVVASPGIRDFNAPFAAMWVDPAPMVAAAAQPQWIAPFVFMVWACGFTAIVLRRVRQWREVRAAVRASTPFTAATPMPVGIEIRTAPTVLEPGVVGLLRPVILLPEGIDSYLTADQLAAVLAHEVCHVRRRDNLTAALHMLVEAVFWFHPLVWRIGACLVATREQACDEHVVAETAEPIAYAEGIVSVCRRYVETPHMAVAGVGGADLRARIDAILANRFGLRLTLSKRLVLAAVAALSLTVPIVTGAIEAAAFAAGQLNNPLIGPAIDPESRFEVVSIKRADASAQLRLGMTPGRIELVGLPVRAVVAMVLPIRRVFGWPDGIDAERYTIAAKMPDGAPQAAMQVAIRNLLKDRFRLVTHEETRELPIYNLVRARSDGRLGPALKESSAECQKVLRESVEAFRSGAPAAPPPPAFVECIASKPGMGIVSMKGVAMGAFVSLLPQFVERPVIDRTGLTSLYDLTLKWTPEATPSLLGLPQAPLPPADPDVPDIFTALQEQLGLKLEAGRGPVEVIVIDRLEKPTLD